MSNWWQVVAGVTNNGKEGSEGGSSNGDSTAATLSPKNEPHAGVEKVCFTYPSCQFCRTPIGILSFQAVKGEKEDEGGSLNAPNSRVSMIHQHTLPSREGHPHFYQKNFQGEPAAKRPRQHSQGHIQHSGSLKWAVKGKKFSACTTQFCSRYFVLKYVVKRVKKDFQVESGLLRDLFWSRVGPFSLFAPKAGQRCLGYCHFCVDQERSW